MLSPTALTTWLNAASEYELPEKIIQVEAKVFENLAKYFLGFSII